MNKKDFYDILGIERKASKDDIKKAFHKLAKKYHPDNKQGGDESKFKEINEAYHTLTNDQKRAEYDAYGHTFNGAGGGSPFGDFSGFQGAQGFDFSDLGDIFGDFFGGGAGRARGTRKGRDISVDMRLSFVESIFGGERTMLLAKTVSCAHCKATGGEPSAGTETCTSCNGQGRVHETRQSMLGAITSVRECAICNGEGKIPKKKCAECRGLGVIKRQEEMHVTIPSGIQHGEMIRLSGMGEAVAHGIPGDLYVRVHVEQHPVFKREGDTIAMDLNIKLSDAILGAEYHVPLPEGGTITLAIPAGISIGEVLRVAGKGVPKDAKRRGDMLVRLRIQLPKKLSRKAKQAFEDLKSEGI